MNLGVVRSRLGWDIRLSLRVDRHSLVRHISDVSVVVVGSVFDMLGPAVGKSNRVGSGDSSGAVSGLSSVEGGLGVVISNTILESIGGGLLLLIGGGLVGSRGRVVGSRVVGGDLHDRSVVDNGGSVVDDGSSVVGRSQGNWAGVDSMTNSGMAVASSSSWGNLSKTLVVVSLVNGSMAGTKSLGDP